ncbi:MAG: Rieske 2Fe-2S domain-containing protein [Acidimicrobiia bacterium]
MPAPGEPGEALWQLAQATTSPPRRWVVVAASEELGRELTGRRAWGQQLAMYRTRAGVPVVLVDRCCHRQFPLSASRLCDDDVVCGYHGFRFAPDGRCVHVPSQEAVPARAAVRSFPTVEHGGWVWSWLATGTPDELRAPDALVGDTWRSAWGSCPMEAPAVLLVENLHDLSHIPYVHASTIGSAAFAERPYEAWSEDGVLRTRRIWSDVDCPPMYQRSAGLTGPVDRVIESEFHVPSLVVIDSQIRPAGRGPDQARRIVHEIALVPATAESLTYLWRSSWNFALGDDDVAEVIGRSEGLVAAEDADVLRLQWAAQQAMGPDEVEVSVRSDAGSLRARRAFAQVVAGHPLPDDAAALAEAAPR